MTDNDPDPKDPISSDLVKDDASFADIVVQFVDGLTNRIDAMDGALSSADFEALRVAAHQLKGSGGGYGYPILTDRAAKLEEWAKAQTLDECQTCLDELKDICARVIVGP